MPNSTNSVQSQAHHAEGNDAACTLVSGVAKTEAQTQQVSPRAPRAQPSRVTCDHGGSCLSCFSPPMAPPVSRGQLSPRNSAGTDELALRVSFVARKHFCCSQEQVGTILSLRPYSRFLRITRNPKPWLGSKWGQKVDSAWCWAETSHPPRLETLNRSANPLTAGLPFRNM